MVKVSFYDCSYLPAEGLTYSVISASFNGKWIFIRHKRRGSYEIPGGHIESGETADEAAHRELREETGAEDFNLQCVATYSVNKDGHTGWGRLFLAEVLSIGAHSDQSEVDEVIFSDTIPERLTYPDIQPLLFEKVLHFIQLLKK